MKKYLLSLMLFGSIASQASFVIAQTCPNPDPVQSDKMSWSEVGYRVGCGLCGLISVHALLDCTYNARFGLGHTEALLAVPFGVLAYVSFKTMLSGSVEQQDSDRA